MSKKTLERYLTKIGCLKEGEHLSFDKKGHSQPVRCPNPNHPDTHPSAYIDKKSGRIRCHWVCKKWFEQDEVIHLYKEKIKLIQTGKLEPTDLSIQGNRKSRKSGPPNLYPLKPDRTVSDDTKESLGCTEVYTYTDLDETPWYFKFRFEPKRFMVGKVITTGNPELPDLELALTIQGVRDFYPYMVDCFSESKHIIIVEGEKDADNLFVWLVDNGYEDWTATTFIDLENKDQIDQCCRYLKGKNVYLCADIDSEEKKFAGQVKMYENVGPFVAKYALTTRILDLGLKPGTDVSDLLKQPNGNIILANAIKNRSDLARWVPHYWIERQKIPEIILDIDREYSGVLVPPNFMVMQHSHPNEKSDTLFELINPTAMKSYYKRNFIDDPFHNDEKKDPKKVNPYDVWEKWKGTLNYEKILFDPSETCGQTTYNTWRGLLNPNNATSCKRFKHHLLYVICNNNESHYRWLMAWLADIVQNPDGDPKGTIVALIGQYQGTGKSIVGKYFRKIFGPHAIEVHDKKQLFGQFNYHLTYRVFVQAEEALWGGDPKIVGRIKNLASSDVLPVEIKYGSTFTTKSYLRIMITSNEKKAVSAVTNDRRHCVFEPDPEYRSDRSNKKQQAKHNKYFNALVKEMNNGGPEALMKELMEIDLSKYDLSIPPSTKAHGKQVINNLEPLHAAFYTILFEFGSLIDPDRVWNEYDKTLPKDIYENSYMFKKLQKKWYGEKPVPFGIVYDQVQRIINRSARNLYDKPSQKEVSDFLCNILELERSKQRRINWPIVMRTEHMDIEHPEGISKPVKHMIRPKCVIFGPLKEMQERFQKNLNITLEDDEEEEEV